MWYGLQVVELPVEFRARCGVQVFSDQVDQLVGVLTWGRYTNCPWPIVVHVSQLVGQLLDGVGRKGRRLFDHHEVGRGHGSLVYALRDEEEVLELEPEKSAICFEKAVP